MSTCFFKIPLKIQYLLKFAIKILQNLVFYKFEFKFLAFIPKSKVFYWQYFRKTKKSLFSEKKSIKIPFFLQIVEKIIRGLG